MKRDQYIIISLIVVATVALSFVVPPFYAAILIPALCLGVLLMGNPRRFLYFYLFVMGIYPLLKEVLPIAPVKYLNELMGLILFGLFFGHLALRRLDFRYIGKWKALFGFLAGYAVLTWMVNRGSPKAAMQTMFVYFSFIPFFILSVSFLTRRDLRILVLGSIGFFWLNFLLNVTWFMGINPLPNWQLARGNMVDVSLGTFHSQTILAYFCAMLLFILFSFKVGNVKILGRRKNWLVNATLVALLIQFYLTYSNHAYLYFCLAFIPYAIFTGLWKKWQAVAGVSVFIFLAVLTFSFSEQLQLVFEKENIHLRKERLNESAKIRLFNDLIVKNRRDDPVAWAFGVGPGNGMGMIGKDNHTPFALKMLLPYYQTSADYFEQQMDSITGNTNSAIFTLWSDYGLFGFLLFLAIYIRFYVQSLRRATLHKKTGEMQYIATGLTGALAMYFISNITFDVLALSSVCCWLWMFAALLALPEEEPSEDDDRGRTAVSAVEPGTEGGGLPVGSLARRGM